LQHCSNTNNKKQKILIAQTKSEEFSEEFKELLQEPIRNNSRIDLWYSINNETKTKSNVIFILFFQKMQLEFPQKFFSAAENAN